MVTGGTVRVASYNLRGFRDDLAAATRVVRVIAPDVLCLQEVPRHPFAGHRVSDLAQACGLLWSGDHGDGGGTTVFTSLRLDVDGSAHVRLPVSRGHGTRGYAVTRVTLPGHRPLRVASLHLGLDARERVRQVAAVLEALTGAGSGSGPLVVAGDLNEGSDGAAWGRLAAALRPVSPDRPTFPARVPTHRIDAVFAPSELDQPGHGPQVDLRLAPEDLVRATDHLPVWADLELPALTPAQPER